MRPRQFTDQELFETARRLFLEHGPSLPTSRIAEELGVSQGALFKRVGTKQELLRRALFGGTPLPAWIGIVEAGPDERPLREQMIELAQRIDRFFHEVMPAIATLKAAGVRPTDIFDPDDDPPPIKAHRAISGWFARLVEAGRIEVDDCDALAVAFLGALQAPHALRHIIGRQYPDGGPNYAEVLVDTLLTGIAPEDSHA